MQEPCSNIVLIGMPGAGKSTIGVLLAKASLRRFVDTDVVIQARYGARLMELIEAWGMRKFREVEQQVLLELEERNSVIATGGSAVYSEAAMRHLQTQGRIVFLDVPLATLRERLGNMLQRGVVISPGQSLDDLFEERMPLYQRYAEQTVSCVGRSMEAVVAEIVDGLDNC
ncbi:MAG: shikimate kinase [Planctomycetaceae bacterium]|nr:shikimate kinase [Planctomycetaceae bacterium]